MSAGSVYKRREFVRGAGLVGGDPLHGGVPSAVLRRGPAVHGSLQLSPGAAETPTIHPAG